MRKLNRNRFVKTNESYRPKFTKICYTGKGIQLEDGEGRVLRGKVFSSEEEARAYATKMYGYCVNESDSERFDKDEDEWQRAHPEMTCDRCGFSSDQEDYFSIVDGEVLCYDCKRNVMRESRMKTMNRKRRIDENSTWRRIDESRNLDIYDEGWLGDKMKAGWDAVKKGAKKVGKAIGDAFNGPFRKGDQIVMKGEDGESFKGTIMDYDRGDKTYEVMLGKAVNEDWDGRGLQEDVLDMDDREDELVNMIIQQIDDLRREDPELIKDFALNCAELEKIKPGKLDEIINQELKLVNEETREEIAYLKSIGEYDDYKKMISALKAKNAKKKSTKKPAKRKWGGASKKSARKPISRPAEKKYKYSFSASGYGTKTYSFPSEEECLKEMKQDAEATALDYGGEVQWWDDKECVVIDGDGQELGTFVYLGASR